MKLRNLFYLLLALSLVFAACEAESDDVNKTPEVKEPVLTLTSNAEVDVTAAGGEFEITYTLENKKEGVELTATCEADWVSVTAGDKVKVVIEANEGEAREAKVVVAYEAQKFEVTYKQAAKEQGEEPVKPEDPEKPVLTLTSEATLEFTAEGGDGEITYTLENAVEDVELAATCEATWVTELTAGEKVTFKVAANEGEARETKVVVAYGELNFEVAVKQAKKVVPPALTLTSEATLEFAAEGGDGEITYTLENAVEGVELAATCEAAWVTELKAEEKVTFKVAANDGEARETKVVVAYGEQKFEVAVKQVAKEQTEDPKPAYKMDVTLAVAMRIPSSEIDLANNYVAVAFADDAENVELGVVFKGAEGDTVLTAGTYTSGDNTLLLDMSELTVYEPEGNYSFVEGAVAVTLAGDVYTFDMEFKDADGNAYRFVYEGAVLDMEVEEEVLPVEFEPKKVVAYRESYWDTGNFTLQLYVDDTQCHELDMYDKENPNTKHLSAGLYSMSYDSIGSQYSAFVANAVTGEGASVVDAEILLSYNADGTSTLFGFIKSDKGHHITIDWTGVISGFSFEPDEEENEGGETGGETGGDGATVWDIVTVAWGYMSESYNDIVLKTPPVNGEANTFTFELAAAVTNNKLPDGVYKSTDGTIAINYCKHTVNREMTKMTEAEVTITNNADGTTAIAARWTVNGNLNSAQWVGELPEYELYLP